MFFLGCGGGGVSEGWESIWEVGDLELRFKRFKVGMRYTLVVIEDGELDGSSGIGCHVDGVAGFQLKSVN